MGGLLKELRRRNVFRVAGVYGVVGWLLAQAAGVLESALLLPGWFDTIVVSLLLIGFPVALILAWAFEVTPEGVKLTARVPDAESISEKTGRRLDYAILIGLALVAAIVIADRFWPDIRDTAIVENASVADAPPAQDVTPETAVASIAVLPFTDLSPDGDQQYFSDGMAEEILNVLARVDGLKVASRTSSFRFRGGAGEGAGDIADALDVRYVLEGSVRRAGEAIRITAQLVDGETDAHLWSQTYDRTLTVDNIFEIQDEISSAIVEELGAGMGLGRAEAVKFAAAAGTDNLRAYDAFLEGREMFLARDDYDPNDILAKLEEVVRLDPDFARGWSALAAAYAAQESWRNTSRDYPVLAIEAAERAHALDAGLAMPHGVIGMVSRLPDGRPDKVTAVERLTQAIELDPNDPVLWSWRGQHLTELGFIERAESDLVKAMEINPFDIISNAWRFKADLYQGEIDTATDRMPPHMANNQFINVNLIIAGAGHGDTELRIRRFKQSGAGKNMPQPSQEALIDILTNPGADADEAFARFLAPSSANQRTAFQQRPLWLYAFRQFGQIRDLPDLVGDAVWWLRAHEDYLQSPERYRLMHEQGLPDYWRAKSFPPQCRKIDPLPDGRDYECD